MTNKVRRDSPAPSRDGNPEGPALYFITRGTGRIEDRSTSWPSRRYLATLVHDWDPGAPLTRTALTLPALALMLALTMAGCTTAPPAADTALSPTPEATPSTEVLNIEAAGVIYLSTLCVSNNTSAKFDDAVADEDLPFEELLAAAATARNAAQSSAQVLDDPFVAWPEEVAEDIPVVRDMLLGAAGAFAQAANASNRDQMRFIGVDNLRVRQRQWNGTPAARPAGRHSGRMRAVRRVAPH
jgi:hypothetical protein